MSVNHRREGGKEGGGGRGDGRHRRTGGEILQISFFNRGDHHAGVIITINQAWSDLERDLLTGQMLFLARSHAVSFLHGIKCPPDLRLPRNRFMDRLMTITEATMHPYCT